MIYLDAPIFEEVDQSPSLVQVRGGERNPEFHRIQRNTFNPALRGRVKAFYFSSSFPIVRLLHQLAYEFRQDNRLDILAVRRGGKARSIQVFLAKT